jgi:hypothetical protein
MQRLALLYLLTRQLLDGLTKLSILVIGMLAHGHRDVCNEHFGLHLFAHDINYTVESFATLFKI